MYWVVRTTSDIRRRQSGHLSFQTRRGSFNIDVKNVAVGVVLSLKDSDGEAEISHFEVGIGWKDTAFQFERVAGRFTTVANLFINQV